MARTSLIVRNLKKIEVTKNFFLIRTILKSYLKLQLNFAEIFNIQKKIQKLPKKSLPIAVRNRCMQTGRSRGYLGDFGLSRHTFRELAHQGDLPGITKSSW
jgi:small subunit ribosomal protein S14